MTACRCHTVTRILILYAQESVVRCTRENRVQKIHREAVHTAHSGYGARQGEVGLPRDPGSAEQGAKDLVVRKSPLLSCLQAHDLIAQVFAYSHQSS